MTKRSDKQIQTAAKTRDNRWLGRVHAAAWCVVVVLVLFQALIANSQANVGSMVSQLQAEQGALATNVELLERSVATNGSLAHIKTVATEKLGMKPIDKNILYLPLPTEAQP